MREIWGEKSKSRAALPGLLNDLGGKQRLKQPSILLITTDEQHRDTVLRTPKPMETPAIDRLLACSDVYTGAYSVSPVCLPARCSWMNGRYPHCSANISNQMGASLSLNAPNLFTCLKKAGYGTSLHGKCHFIPVPYPATRPDRTLEYEHFRFYYSALGMDRLDLQDDKNNSLWYYDDFAKELEREGKLTLYRETYHGKYEKCTLPHFPLAPEDHPDCWTGRKALEHLDRLDGQSPQFMWVSFSGPHYPMDAPDEYFDRVHLEQDYPRAVREGEWEDGSKLHAHSYYGPGGTEGSGNAPGGAQKAFDEEYWKDWRTRYYANIAQIDEQIGRIVDKAKAVFGEENLVILFTSDHGDMMGNHNLWGKNHSLHEDVLRVPIVLHHPGQQERRDIPQTVSSLEVFPTILSLAGCPLPESCDGIPLEEMALRGGREYIISECDYRVAVIQDGLKLCWNVYERTGQMYHELYDLKNDPMEFVNLYEDPSYRQRRDALIQILNRHEEQEGLLSTVFYDGKSRPYWFAG